MLGEILPYIRWRQSRENAWRNLFFEAAQNFLQVFLTHVPRCQVEFRRDEFSGILRASLGSSSTVLGMSAQIASVTKWRDSKKMSSQSTKEEVRCPLWQPSIKCLIGAPSKARGCTSNKLMEDLVFHAEETVHSIRLQELHFIRKELL